jgi:hypothetical protein
MATVIDLEEGWARIRTQGIDRLFEILEGGLSSGKARFSNRDYSMIYT